MKKSILLALIAVGLTGSFFVGRLRSQDQIQLNEGVQLQLKEGVEVKNLFIGTPQERKSQRLRSEHQQLVKQLLQIINEQELTARIADLKKELGEHQAKAKLEHAKKLLQEILKTYPKSEAAKEAGRMLGIQKKAEKIERNTFPNGRHGSNLISAHD